MSPVGVFTGLLQPQGSFVRSSQRQSSPQQTMASAHQPVRTSHDGTFSALDASRSAQRKMEADERGCVTTVSKRLTTRSGGR